MRPWRFAMASLLAATSSSPSSSSSIDTVARKAAIRSQVKAALKTLTDTDIQERSAAVEAALHRMPEWGRSKVLCLYLSMTPEVQTYGCIQRAFGDGKRVFIPKVTGKRPEDMVMFELENYAAIDTFPKSKWGIPEPPLELVQRSVDGATLGAVDTVIVPLCAFDSLCGRVGHGKGYYDSFIGRVSAANAAAGAPPPVTIGLAFDEQRVDAVPLEPHDCLLDYIVTPSALYSRLKTG